MELLSLGMDDEFTSEKLIGPLLTSGLFSFSTWLAVY
jgi:hypothetical protein